MPPSLDMPSPRYSLSYSPGTPFSVTYLTDIGSEPNVMTNTTPSNLEELIESIVEKKVREILEAKGFILGKLPDKADEKKFEEALGAAQSGEERDEVWDADW